jgi:hypothetical protein
MLDTIHNADCTATDAELLIALSALHLVLQPRRVAMHRAQPRNNAVGTLGDALSPSDTKTQILITCPYPYVRLKRQLSLKILLSYVCSRS